jgi:hypothetical protein
MMGAATLILVFLAWLIFGAIFLLRKRPPRAEATNVLPQLSGALHCKGSVSFGRVLSPRILVAVRSFTFWRVGLGRCCHSPGLYQLLFLPSRCAGARKAVDLTRPASFRGTN